MPNSKRRQQRVEEDLQQLRGLIPCLNGVKGDLSQTEIMNEAARYIDQLQNNLVCHIRTHGYPDKMKNSNSNSSSNSSSSSNVHSKSREDSDSIKKNLESYIVGSSRKWSK